MRKQQGHAGIIIVVSIVGLVVLGALGYVFWQNFINKPASTNTATTIGQLTKAGTDSTLTETGTVTYKGTTLTFKYPSAWTLKKETAYSNMITSPDTKADVYFTLLPPEGIGGTCDSATTQPVVDPIVSAEWSAIPAVSKVIFSKHIIHYVASKSNGNTNDYYTFGFGAVPNTDAIKSVKSGDSSCEPFIFSQYVELKISSGAVLQANADFSALNASGPGQQKMTNTQSDIQTQFDSDNAKTAEAIIKSISLN